MNCTVEHLVELLGKLPADRSYHYIETSTHTQIRLISVTNPVGPITIARHNPATRRAVRSARVETISSNMLRRVAHALTDGLPLNLDRVLGASYNTRSALETLLAHTPEFYYCYPGRIEVQASSTEIKRGHKHLLWLPSQPHKPLQKTLRETSLVISELPSASAVYEAVTLPELAVPENGEINIEAARMHARIQAALVKIAYGFGGKAHVAKNDQGIAIGSQKFAEMEGVITDLRKEALFSIAPAAIPKAALIDCIWLRNGKYMPAVLEVEHSTGVTSGLTRMLGFKNAFIDINTRYVIAAPDEDADKVMRECCRPEFRALDASFLPYSNVHELYALQQKNRLTGVGERFFENFLIKPKCN